MHRVAIDASSTLAQPHSPVQQTGNAFTYDANHSLFPSRSKCCNAPPK